MDTTNTLTVAKCTQRLDDSVDAAAPDCAVKLFEHLRARTPATLDAIPVRPGVKRLRTYDLRPLMPAEYAHALRQSPGADPANGLTYDQCAEAAAMAVVAIHHPDGNDESVTQTVMGKITVSPEAWTGKLFALGAASLLHELGAVAIKRAQIGDAGPFSLPPGTTLGR